MLPVCYPSSPSPVTGLPEAVAYALSSVSGLTRWVDYIPIKLVSGAAATGEGKTDVGGFVAIDLLSSDAGLNAWRDYLPVYVDNSATDAWITSAAGYIPYAPSGGSAAAKQFFLNLSNASVGNITDAQGVCTITNVGDLNPVIAVNRSTGVAPLHIQFDASGTQCNPSLTSVPFHELYYAWSFADERGATWSYGPKAGVANKNTAYGPVAAHVFETAGTYTVTLWVYHLSSGGVITSKGTTSTVTVTAADTVFAGNTVVMSTGTDFTGAPTGTQIGSATITDINNNLLAGKRVLLKRGDTWNATAVVSITNSGPGILGAWGSGALPVINMTANLGTMVLSAASDWRVMDINITTDGIYNANKGGLSLANGGNNLFLRCDFSQGRNNISVASTDGLAFVDCISHDCFTTAGICAFIDKADNLAILGTWMYLSTDHTCRIQGTAKCVVSNSHFERPSPNGCALTIRGKANDGDVTHWSGLWTEKVIVSDCILTTDATRGGFALATEPQASGHAERLRNLITERCIISAEDSTPVVGLVSTGWTIRNNIIVSRNTYAISFGYTSTSADVVPPPDSIWVYNNSIYKPDTTYINGFSAVVITNTTAITGAVIKNNSAYAPADTRDGYTNGTAPAFFSTNTATEGVHYTLGSNSSDAQVKSTVPFTDATPTNWFVDGVNAVPADYTPTGYAVNGGTYVPIYTDFMNATITGTREIGAIQV